MAGNIRLWCLKLRKSNFRFSIRFLVLLFYVACVVFVILVLVEKSGLALRDDDVGRQVVPESVVLPVPEPVLTFESLFQAGLGANGQGAKLSEQTDKDVQEQLRLYAFNKYLSDRIDVKRDMPDSRHPECRKIDYDPFDKLPTTSVILIFCNEALSVLLRTVWSLIKFTPGSMLKEIILVDDGSNTTEIKNVLPLYLKHRLQAHPVHLHVLPKQTGLISARLAGAKVATGDMLVFLDSHCEATPGWLEPLAQRIKDHPSTVVIPMIDSISDTTLEYFGMPGGLSVSVGGFTWSGHFSWESLAKGGEGRKASDPAPTPTMAGGLFAVERRFFFDIGAYDPGMIGWGGENLELSFRVWMCGGRMETMPCSHVGHIFRATHPYFIPDDSHGKNTARMAEVWMDDYKRFFYLYRTELKGKDFGDLTDRKALRQRLGCKSFNWYLKNIIPHKFVMDEEAFFYGRVINAKFGNAVCFDHLQRDMGHRMDSYNLGQYPCHAFVGSSQYFTLSRNNELRNEYMCAQADSQAKSVMMFACVDSQQQKWDLTDWQGLKHRSSGLCIGAAASGQPSAELALVQCDQNDQTQKWHFDHANPAR